MTDLTRVTRGVWRSPDELADLPGRCGAILSAMPRGSVLAGVTAARLHGVWLPPSDDDERIELILRRDAEVPRSRPGSTRSEVRARRRVLRGDEVDVVEGLPVTSLARTWVDLAEDLSMPDLVALGDCALRLGAREHDLRVGTVRATRRRGVTVARAALPLLDGRSRSRPESHLRVGLITRGLPPPAVNLAIRDGNGQWLAEPDLSYEDATLAIEYNGSFHASTARMRRDITREIDVAVRGGWRTVTVGPAEVFQRMDQTASYIRELRNDRLASAARVGPLT